MSSSRDDFTTKTKEVMAKRVGYRCSNPNCRCLTIGPKTEVDKTVSIGVAAHIKAAAPGGPRYDACQSAEERSSVENGIWLCQTHAKLIDSDVLRYSSDLLYQWKELSEQAARLEVEDKDNKDLESDIQIVKHFAIALDRPAFKDQIMMEGSMEDFYKAMNDTIIAFNTGNLYSRDGVKLKETQGKSFIHDDVLRQQMEVIVNMLRAIRDRYEFAKNNDEIIVSSNDKDRSFVCFKNGDLAHWFDETREEILEIFGTACSRIGFKWDNNFRKRRKYW